MKLKMARETAGEPISGTVKKSGIWENLKMM